MKTEMIAILVVYFGFIFAEILRTNFFKKARQRTKDGIVELIGSLVLVLITQPLILAAIYFIGLRFFPDYQDALIAIPLIAKIAMLLIFDDMTQYWWHRTSHSVPWLYALHRSHHDANYMSIRIVYRNNIFYYAMMPGIWASGVMIFLGLGWVYAVYIVVKMAVICGAHSDIRWEKKLYDIKWLSPVMWVVERTISTSATHSAHHGQFGDDPATNYKGNYGNLLFFWDILFGTAKITRTYPKHYGVENLPAVGVGEQLLWPLIKGPKDAPMEGMDVSPEDEIALAE